jgi:hypothetical protein
MATKRRESRNVSFAPLSGPRRRELSGEGELLRFLSDYERVSGEEACVGHIEQSQLTVWIYIDGRWKQESGDYITQSRRALTGSESWCNWYLKSILSMSQDEYADAKKKLLAENEDLTGVYECVRDCDSKPLYALVYRKSNKATHTGWKILGGVTAAGLSAGFIHEIWKNKQFKKQRDEELSSELKKYDAQLEKVKGQSHKVQAMVSPLRVNADEIPNIQEVHRTQTALNDFKRELQTLKSLEKSLMSNFQADLKKSTEYKTEDLQRLIDKVIAQDGKSQNDTFAELDRIMQDDDLSHWSSQDKLMQFLGSVDQDSRILNYKQRLKDIKHYNEMKQTLTSAAANVSVSENTLEQLTKGIETGNIPTSHYNAYTLYRQLSKFLPQPSNKYEDISVKAYGYIQAYIDILLLNTDKDENYYAYIGAYSESLKNVNKKWKQFEKWLGDDVIPQYTSLLLNELEAATQNLTQTYNALKGVWPDVGTSIMDPKWFLADLKRKIEGLEALKRLQASKYKALHCISARVINPDQLDNLWILVKSLARQGLDMRVYQRTLHDYQIYITIKDMIKEDDQADIITRINEEQNIAVIYLLHFDNDIKQGEIKTAIERRLNELVK